MRAPRFKNPDHLVNFSAVARKMGVSRGHLYRVLSGERISKKLLDRYNRFFASHEIGLKFTAGTKFTFDSPAAAAEFVRSLPQHDALEQQETIVLVTRDIVFAARGNNAIAGPTSSTPSPQILDCSIELPASPSEAPMTEPNSPIPK